MPVEVPGVDLNRFDLSNYYTEEQIKQLSVDLRRERLGWLSQFSGLDRDIISALKP